MNNHIVSAALGANCTILAAVGTFLFLGVGGMLLMLLALAMLIFTLMIVLVATV